eukprot:CAMPEP_0201504748 /NCGR_PEP_ID=MMETSP0151_2-20130828/85386_1 /ASSEMBLY_ACC=CAM_ASM_000257 /TAXON_ID=200890 /ORGANISM="Paramoeba atlantica, Strain 621/1 / CCAP 1560/9" /LENGTH=81 /DNA_ID=CAMNT_0047898535 /DNA_START=191 /DNA_END=436 /DNA_ORIENTATION=+
MPLNLFEDKSKMARDEGNALRKIEPNNLFLLRFNSVISGGKESNMISPVKALDRNMRVFKAEGSALRSTDPCISLREELST